MNTPESEKRISRYRQLRIPVVISLSCILVALIIIGYTTYPPFINATETFDVANRLDPKGGSRGLPDFVSLVKKIKPAVVGISTSQVSRGRRSQGMPSPFREDDPMGEFWKRFFGDPPPTPRGPSRQKSFGSGFIVDRSGLILTNNHVVENADKIIVRLSDQRKLEAKIVGRDQKTDIAVIKIDDTLQLPTVPLGNSENLEVGEWVLAIGNPFGLEHTVTSGIVSAKDRNIGAGPYDDFIQTDASINPGNSGGPLINLDGQVVGINTLIFSRGGGNIGIGFAIPINLVKELLPQLKSKGKVTRGWLGVVIQKVTPALAESLGMQEAEGALVADVSKGGPADKGGINKGDVILEFDGKKVKESKDLPIIVARTSVGKAVPVKVIRDEKETILYVKIGELKDEEVVASILGKKELGLTVQRVTPQIAESLGLSHADGVVITFVEPESPGEEAGLRRTDIILEIDRQAIKSLEDYKRAISKLKKNKGVLFLVRRGETTLFLALKAPR